MDDAPVMKRDSELCMRIARCLSEQRGHGAVTSYVVDDEPGSTAGAAPGVQFVDLCTTSEDGSVMALEHTLIETYERQVEEARQIQSLLVPLEERLAGQFPTGSRFDLLAAHGAVLDVVSRPAVVLAAVEAWIRSTAQDLVDAGSRTMGRHFASAGPPILPVEITLYRWPDHSDGRLPQLSVGRYVADDDEAQFLRRVARLGRALDRKLGKFERYVGHRSVLVLEDVDFATSNLTVVVKALMIAAEGHELCDTIVVAQTAIGVDQATVVFDGGWLDDPDAFAF